MQSLCRIAALCVSGAVRLVVLVGGVPDLAWSVSRGVVRLSELRGRISVPIALPQLSFAR